MFSLKNMTAVIIDDEPELLASLIGALNQDGVSTIAFKPEDVVPLENVRLVFLDLQLIPGVSSDEMDLARGAAAYMDKLMGGSKIAPYILFLWTRHEDQSGAIVEWLQHKPVTVVAMNKTLITGLPTPDAQITSIKAKLELEMNNLPFTQIMFDLENSAKRAVEFTTNALVPEDCKGDDDIGKNLHMLKKAVLGRQTGAEEIKAIKSIMARLISDFMETTPPSGQTLPAIKSTSIKKIKAGGTESAEEEKARAALEERDVKTRIKLNTALHLDISPSMCMPGNVYEKTDQAPLSWVSELSQLPQNAADKPALQALKQIVLEISPLCDWAQKKLYRHRFVRGVIFPTDLYGKLADAEPVKGKYHYLTRPSNYSTPVLCFADGIGEARLVFDFKYFETEELKFLEGKKSLFRLRTEILSEIQSKMGEHISRLGITSL